MFKRTVTLSLLLALAMAAGAALFHARPAAPVMAAGFYAGQLADGRSLQLVFYPSGTVAAHLVGEPYDATLSFKTNTQHQVEFGVASNGGEGRWQVCGLNFGRGSLPARLDGRLFTVRATNGLAFTATNIGAFKEHHREIGAHAVGRGGGKNFTATWPELHDGVPFHESFSKLFAAAAQGEGLTFTTGGYELIWEGFKDGGASWDWEGSLDIRPVWLAPNLVSLCEDRYEFTGGAHGEAGYIGRNYILDGGKAREFKLEDLFRRDVNWTNALSPLILRELRAQGASGVMAGAGGTASVTGFTADELASFNVDSAGLIIHFPDYAVGSHAEGLFSVLIPWPELRPLLDPAGPGRLFP